MESNELLLLDIKQVAAALNLSIATVERMKAAGELPPPIRLRKRAVRWSRVVLEQWITERQAEASESASIVSRSDAA